MRHIEAIINESTDDVRLTVALRDGRLVAELRSYTPDSPQGFPMFDARDGDLALLGTGRNLREALDDLDRFCALPARY